MSATIATHAAEAPRPEPEPGPDRTAGHRIDWGQPFVYIVALVIAAVAIGPVIYVFIGGFRTTADLNPMQLQVAPMWKQ